MGKTPLAQSQRGWVDLDFGHFRDALSCPKEDEILLVPPFLRLVQAYLDEGWKVVSNEPKLISGGTPRVTRIFLPRMLEYSAKKLGASREVIDGWVADWEAEAMRYRVPITYLDVGLDHYFRSLSWR